MTSDNIKSGVYLAAIAAAGYVAYQAYKKVSGITDGAAELLANGEKKLNEWTERAKAAVEKNISGPFSQGQQFVANGQVRAQPTGPINSDGGAAFGIYPSAFGSNGMGIKESERASWD